MKSSYKLAVLGALGLASVTAVQAQVGTPTIQSSYLNGDLLVGIYQTGIANTTVIDLGSFASLQNGESWTLSTLLGTAGFNSTLDTSSAVFGVVGIDNAANPKQLFATTSLGATPNTIANSFGIGGIRSQINTIGNNEGAQTSGGAAGVDWASETLGTTGLTGALGYNPNASVTDVATLWSIAANGSAPVLDGTFSLNPSSEVLTFNAVPEPTTFGLLGGAGLLILGFRNKLARKNS